MTVAAALGLTAGRAEQAVLHQALEVFPAATTSAELHQRLRVLDSPRHRVLLELRRIVLHPQRDTLPISPNQQGSGSQVSSPRVERP
ncbi:hypothetical protein [Streptosporangium canum]|uniref:hypothetical protein n=1 Tax=Streptosporangium canum TaxID=324952 RepID=UPI003415E960